MTNDEPVPELYNAYTSVFLMPSSPRRWSVWPHNGTSRTPKLLPRSSHLSEHASISTTAFSDCVTAVRSA